MTRFLPISLSVLFITLSAFADYECETSLMKANAPTKVLGSLTIARPTGSLASQKWGRLRIEKKKRDGTLVAIELGGWIDATARDEGGKFSVYRTTYSGDRVIEQTFLQPVQINGSYDRLAWFENYLIRIRCKVTAGK